MSAPRYPESWSSLKVALCHDWLTGMRGGERCLELLAQGFPDAPIHTLIHRPAAISAAINAHPVRTSWLQGIPGIHRHYRNWLPFFPAAIRGFKAADADLLISTSHCVAKAMPRKASTKHICYCFTPMRYAWSFHEEYIGSRPKRFFASPILKSLRKWDRKTAANVDQFVAISEHVKKRIREFYDRDAEVVYPPVNTSFFTPGATTNDGYDLIVSALVPYKRVDLAVAAYAKLGTPLKIVGSGTDFEKLKAGATGNVEFLGRKSDEEIRELYRLCRLLIFPGEEDFGIVPLEAHACGKPVVAFRRGGALETILDGETGLFFNDQTPESLSAAIEKAGSKRWDPAAIRAQALRFDTQRFIDGMDRIIRKMVHG